MQRTVTVKVEGGSLVQTEKNEDDGNNNKQPKEEDGRERDEGLKVKMKHSSLNVKSHELS